MSSLNFILKEEIKMATYIVYGVNPWTEDTVLGEFDNRDEALIFELEEKMKNKENKRFAFVTSKVIL